MDVFQQPLRDHMSAPVITTSADAPLDEVVALLRRSRVTSAPVVGRDGRAVGVLTYSDLLQTGRFFSQGAGGEDLLQLPSMCAGDLVRPGVINLGPDATLADAAQLLHARGVQRVYVLEEDRVVGVYSTHDLTRAIGDAGLATPIGELMRSPVPVLQASDPATSAVNLVQGATGSCVVVLDGDLLAGVVTQNDALAARERPRDTAVGEIVGYSAICLDRRTPVYRAARFAAATRARRVVVTDAGHVCGVLSGTEFAAAVVRAAG